VKKGGGQPGVSSAICASGEADPKSKHPITKKRAPGSGDVEATCKSLAMVRMKRPDARWKHTTGKEVLQLRALGIARCTRTFCRGYRVANWGDLSTRPPGRPRRSATARAARRRKLDVDTSCDASATTGSWSRWSSGCGLVSAFFELPVELVELRRTHCPVPHVGADASWSRWLTRHGEAARCQARASCKPGPRSRMGNC